MTRHAVPRAIALWLVLGLLATLAVQPSAHAADNVFTGTVIDADTEEPLAGIEVEAFWEFVTDEEFLFDNGFDVTAADGTYRIELDPEYAGFIYSVSFLDPEGRYESEFRQQAPDALDVALAPAAAVEGVVVGADDGAPVTGQIVALTPLGGGFPVFASTDADGAFFAGPLQEGVEYRIRFPISQIDESDVYFVVGREVVTAPGDDIELQVRAAGASAAGFSDVGSGHPFDIQISWLFDQGITGGFDNDEFRPTQPVTRQAAAAFLYRYAGEPEVSEVAGFADVPEEHPFQTEIAWMVEEGIASGFDGNEFRPTEPVTRRAAAAFLYRYFVPEEQRPGDGGFFDGLFDDVTEDTPFATEIEWMALEGYATGWPDDTFRPGRDVTRQAMASFLFNTRGTFGGGVG